MTTIANFTVEGPVDAGTAGGNPILIGYIDGSGNTQAITGNAAGGGNTIAGAANIAHGQVTTSTTEGTLVAARPTRRTLTVKNTDASITVYVGAASVTAGNGFPLTAGQSVTLDCSGLIGVVAASGTPVVAYCETYD